MRQNFTHWEKLAKFLEWDEDLYAKILKNPTFTLNLPVRLANKIAKNTLDDPILRQFLPTQAENAMEAGFSLEPVADSQFRKSSKLLHKYQGRALLVCTSACAMHCRFCFRQNFDYETKEKSFQDELKIIAEDPSLQEIILSGGDPLSLSNSVLKDLLDELAQIPHVRRVRFHTRFPIGIPERIDADFVSLLENRPYSIWMVLHINHPLEIDTDVIHHLHLLQKRGILLLNQWVLLKGVNDSEAVLTELCELLVNHSIFPYYLHQLDQVKGTSHFKVPVEEGRALIEAISKNLPGYAVPKYVCEIPGKPNKTPL